MSALAAILALAPLWLPGTAVAAEVKRNILKTFFEKGDKPTQPQFATLIDSLANTSSGSLDLSFDSGATPGGHTVSFNAAGMFAQTADGKLIPLQNGQRIGPITPDQTLVPSGSLGASSLWAGQTGFLGLQFELVDAGGNITTHYGFVQMRVDGAASPTPYAIHVDSFTYETIPGMPVTAAVPAPAGLVLLGSGLLGMAGLARRKQAAFELLRG